MAKELTKVEARKELNDIFFKAFGTIVSKRPEAVQAVVIAQYPAKSSGQPPKSYLIACYMERTREEDALDAILTDKNNGYWEFDYQDAPVTTIQLKTITKTEYNIKGILKIHYKGYDFIFNNGGTGDTYKAAISDAFKRCCGDAGFTRKFWQQKRVWVKATEEVKKLFTYGSPTLKEIGADINKQEIFLEKSPHLQTLSREEFLALEESKEIPETMMIENGKKVIDLVVSRYFTKSELKIYSEQNTDEEIIRIELEHRSHYTYNYKPKSPLIYSRLSRMQFKTTDEQWKQWGEKAKKENFKDANEDKQNAIIDEFAIDIEDAKKVLEKK